MKPLRWVILGMAALAVSATFVLAQSGVLGRVGHVVEGLVTGVAAEAEFAVDRGRGAAASQSAVDFRWTGQLAEGRSLEIKGINGSITAVPAPGAEVVVTAEARGRRSDPNTVRIEVVEHRDGVTVCAVYPTPEGKRENYCAAEADGRMSTNDNDVRVQFRVEVPRGVRFIGHTVNGTVEALGLESDVRAITVNGDIELSTEGFAEAETVNGSIDAVVGSADLGDGVSFSTVNGSISLDLNDAVDADVDASWLNGSFETDLPFALQGRLSRRSARGVLGDGGPRLELSTVNGSIRIR
jgi:hypothetical protein